MTLSLFYRILLTAGVASGLACTDDSGSESPEAAADAIIDAAPDDALPPADAAPVPVDAGPPPNLQDPVVLTPGAQPVTSIQPAVALTADGAVALAWCAAQDSDLGIWFALLGPDGTPLRAPYPIDTTRVGVQNEPAICALAEGGFVVVWSMDAQEAAEPGQNLYLRYRRLDAEGNPIDAQDIEIDTGSEGNHWLGEVACAPDGGFLVVGARSEANMTFGVFGQRFAADGATVGDPIALNSDPMGTQVFPTVDIARNGDAVIAWEDTPFAGADAVTRVVARRLPAGASTPPAPEVIITRPIYDATKPSVAMDPDTGEMLVAVFLDDRRIGLFRVGDDDTPEELTAPAGGLRHSPVVAAAGDGRYLLHYVDGINAGASPRLALVGPTGIEDGPVELGVGNIPPYSVALDHRDGVTVAAWTERRVDEGFVLRLARVY